VAVRVLPSKKKENLRTVLLLPKLRRHFAEFLRDSSLIRLSIPYQQTSVGLGYGFLFRVFPEPFNQKGLNLETSFSHRFSLLPFGYYLRGRYFTQGC